MGKKTNLRSYEDIREYVREFYIDSYKSMNDYGSSNTKYNKRDQIRYWLGDYFYEDKRPKSVPYLAFDTWDENHNPLYRTFKFKQVNKESLRIHFALLSKLAKEREVTIRKIVIELDETDVSDGESAGYTEQTVQNVVNEYVEKGILVSGRRDADGIWYRASEDKVDLDKWRDAVDFFSEADPLGLIGSYILEQFEESESVIRQKHNFMFPAMDSIVLFEIIKCIEKKRGARITAFSQEDRSKEFEADLLPLQIMISAESGRQYLVAYNYASEKIRVYRLDTINSVEPKETDKSFDSKKEKADELYKYAWNVALGDANDLKQLRVEFFFQGNTEHMVRRLYREKRIGRIDDLGEGRYLFTVETFDLRTVKPFLRSFIGSIDKIETDDNFFLDEWNREIELYKEMY